MNEQELLNNARRYAVVSSTNDVARACAEDGAPEGTLILADAQECGRGTRGRSFLSPEGGLYMSLVLRPTANPLAVTTAAAVAVAKAVEHLTNKPAQIKWVNDVYQDGKKICGILTEGAFAADGSLRYAILGIGVNLREPRGGFRENLKTIAGGLFPSDAEVDRESFTLDLLREFLPVYEHLADAPHLADYRSRDLLCGRQVRVLRGDAVREAAALSIGNDFSLRVRYADKSEENLQSGEVSIRWKEHPSEITGV